MSYPYTLVLDEGQASEELVTVTNAVGTNLTVIRGADGTTAASHSPGAEVKHVVSARDYREPQDHLAATSDVHGVTGALVGATSVQTLTNKTLTAPVVEGDLTLNNGSFVGTRLHAALELGANGTDNNPLIDFHTGRNSDYDVRIQASPAGGGGVGLGLLGISAGSLQVNGDEVVRQVATQTLTNKTLALGSNSLSGTLAQLNTAITDADLASLAGTETLTNKTLTSPTINNPTISSPTISGGTIGGSASFTGSGGVSTSGSVTTTGQMGLVNGSKEVIIGYGGGGGISIGANASGFGATHPNGVVLWVNGSQHLMARMPGGNDVQLA